MIQSTAYIIGVLIGLVIAALPAICFILLLVFIGKKIFGSKTNRERKEPIRYEPDWKWDEDTKQWEPPLTPAQPKQETTPVQKESSAEEIDYRNAYQAKQLFTRNEWQNYQKLREVARVKNYEVCPKVRLLDIIEPRRGEKKYKTLFYKVQAKHVDFVICDQNMNIKAIIELDDSSHDRKDRQERDQFVDMILQSVGYKVIHTRYINYDILDLV